jgi:hypothetical protein
MTGPLRLFLDDSIAAKVQALLWEVGPDTEKPMRLANVDKILAAYQGVTSFAPDAKEQRRLVAGWAATNLAQAISLTGLTDHPGVRFLTDVCYGPDENGRVLLWWTTGANWLASFADSRLAIAAVSGGSGLWNYALNYFEVAIAQSIYHDVWDGLAIRSLTTPGQTQQHWNHTADRVPPSLSADRLSRGETAEEDRDLSHDMMGLAAWVHGALTIVHQGCDLPRHVTARLVSAYERKAAIALNLMGGGSYQYPLGGGAWKTGWLPALTLFGSYLLPTVDSLLAQHPSLATSGVGYNHLIAEGLTDAR